MLLESLSIKIKRREDVQVRTQESINLNRKLNAEKILFSVITQLPLHRQSNLKNEQKTVRDCVRKMQSSFNIVAVVWHTFSYLLRSVKNSYIFYHTFKTFFSVL